MRTPTGTINVCGQCLRPSHKAEECRREMTCRRCGGVGHKGLVCTGVRRKTTVVVQTAPSESKQTQQKPAKREKRPNEGKPKTKPTKLSVTDRNQKTGKETEEMENHYLSLAFDSDLMAGTERMRKFSIAKVTEIRGVVDCRRMTELLKSRVAEQGGWEVKPLKDGRYLVECPSAETARKIEKDSPMESPAYTITFTPWTTDLYRPAKAEGAMRWVTVKNLPMFCWGRDSTARMLKPVGDLVHMGEHGGGVTEDIQVLLRLRKPRLLPAALHCSIKTLQHTYIVEMIPGQPPLPWDTRPGTVKEGGDIAINESTMERLMADHNNSGVPPASKNDKGKAPITVLQVTPARHGGGRQKGIIIREPQEPRTTHRSIATAPEPAVTIPAGAAEVTEDGTLCQAEGVTRDGLEVGREEKTGQADSINVADPSLNCQPSEDEEEIDFADAVRTLTAVWQHHTVGSDSGSIPDKLDHLVRSNHLEMEKIKLSDNTPPGGAHNHGKGAQEGTHVIGPQKRLQTHPLCDKLANIEGQQAIGPTNMDLVQPEKQLNQMGNTLPEQGLGHNTREASLTIIPNEASTDVMTNEVSQSKSPVRPSNYIKAHYNPNDSNIKAQNNGIEIDLSNASLRKIGNSWNLITDEAWLLITSKKSHKDSHHLNPPGTQSGLNEEREGLSEPVLEAPQEEQPLPPKPRGRPKKSNLPQATTTMPKQKPATRQQKSTRGRKKDTKLEEQPPLTTVPITLSHWPNEGIISEALKVGVLLECAEGNAEKREKKREMAMRLEKRPCISHHGKMEREQFMEWLKHVDANGDGMISKKELQDALRELGMDWVRWKARRGMVHADLNKNHYVDGDKEMDKLIAYARTRWGILVT
ncbi:hypothetical protein J5N97_016926 [Dioscorea zingiberensis]|uniref:EF-hand domain-containing protein n=1 Tax=Dioscorea zingiberensis TaxID=325984 RepID=A0A9D5CK85_9LILI|nr:hypothetical protein J5N97_016926 [Dioscorea zingiberensis]